MLSLNSLLHSVASAPATQLGSTPIDGLQSRGADLSTFLPLPIMALLALIFVSASIAILIELRAENSNN